jgi:hypothetical protein
MLMLCSSTLNIIRAEWVANNVKGDGRGPTEGTTRIFLEELREIKAVTKNVSSPD